MGRGVVLLRGINVGAHRRIKMSELVPACEELGFGRPTAYLQSGNLVFESAELAGDDSSLRAVAEGVSDVVRRDFGLVVPCQGVAAQRLADAAAEAAGHGAETAGAGAAEAGATGQLGVDGEPAGFGVERAGSGVQPAGSDGVGSGAAPVTDVDEKLVHIVFWDPPTADDMEAFRAGTEELSSRQSDGAFGGDRVEISPDHAILRFAGSSHQSKITLSLLERWLGVSGTARNLRTVRALL